MSELSYVTQNEFNLATKRIDEENKRQNERLQSLETNYAVVNQLSIHGAACIQHGNHGKGTCQARHKT